MIPFLLTMSPPIKKGVEAERERGQRRTEREKNKEEAGSKHVEREEEGEGEGEIGQREQREIKQSLLKRA